VGQVAKNRYEYLHYDTESIIEGSEWQVPDVITLRDAAGVAIPSSQMATMVMTLYNVSTNSIVNGVEQTDIKNTRSCSLSTQGILKVILLTDDTQIINPVNAYEIRRILIEYTWPIVPTKSDAIEITIIIRNVARRPYVSP
jgi:hypothetical protein